MMNDITRPQILRILMLHGFGQSGTEFSFHTKRLCNYLRSSLPASLLSRYPGGITFHFPTGPLEMRATEPFSNSRSSDARGTSKFAWWQTLDDISEYAEFPSSLAFIRDYIMAEGPFDGVVGFSQGAALSMMLASWCETPTSPERRHALAAQRVPVTADPPQRPFQFVISFSGYRGTWQYYKGFYSPRIQTPTLLVTGDWDTLVGESQNRDLASVCANAEQLSHPGSHYVPTGPKYLAATARFIGRVMMEAVGELNKGQITVASPVFDHEALAHKLASVMAFDHREKIRLISSRRPYRVYLRR